MNHRSLILLVAGLSCAWVACAGPAPRDKTLQEKEYYPTGTLAIERELVVSPTGERLRHGVETTWYKTGQKRSVAHFENGLAEGPYVIWDLAGWKLSETSFQAGKRHGRFERWYQDGKLQRRDDYVGGELEGKSETWFSNGKRRSSGLYLAGRKHGEWTYFDREGRLSRRELWERGTLASSEGAEPVPSEDAGEDATELPS